MAFRNPAAQAAAIAAGLLLLSLAACSGSGPRESKSGPTQAAPPSAGAAPAADNGAPRPLFAVKGVPVTAEELEVFGETILPEDFAAGPEALPGVVYRMVTNRLIAEKARADKVQEIPQVRSRIDAVVNAYWSGVYWTEVVRPTVRPTRSDLLKKAPAIQPTARVRQLVVNEKAAAEKLRERALAGEDFAEIVKANSVGLTAEQGGIVDNIKDNTTMYDAKTTAMIFRLKKGEISPVVETPLGFSVFRKEGEITVAQWRERWANDNWNAYVREKEGESWKAAKEKLIRKHKVKMNERAIKGYLEARRGEKDVKPFASEVGYWLDGVPVYLFELVDPSKLGVVHGAETLPVIIRKRIEEACLEQEVERAGLKEKYPKIRLKEKLVTENFLAREYINKRAEGIAASPDDLKRHYEANRDRFVAPRMVDVSVIETKSPDRVKEIYKELAGGVPFEKVARKWSDNQNASAGGRIGLAEADKVAPEFASVLALSPGEYSRKPIVLTPKDAKVSLYVIARLNAVHEKRALSFDEVNKDQLTKAVLANKREQVVSAVIAEAVKKGDVQYFDELDRYRKRMTNKHQGKGGR